MDVQPRITEQGRSPVRGVPPLQGGDRLTRREFERRYEAMPSLKKAELIEGQVYMLAATRLQQHAEPHAFIVAWLGTYMAATLGVRVADNATMRLDLDNEAQPDALLRLETDVGGRSHVSEDDYLEGPPELIVEVAASSASYDLHDKKQVYRRHGVEEYVVWQIYENRLDWFVLEDEEYLTLEPDADGLLKSRAFPGLHLDAEALRTGDLAAVLKAAQTGLETTEHAAFVGELERRRAEQGDQQQGGESSDI